jgi:hypothetical protein
MLTCAHRVEAEVGSDGRVSASPSGAAPAAPPAGARPPLVVHSGMLAVVETAKLRVGMLLVPST